MLSNRFISRLVTALTHVTAARNFAVDSNRILELYRPRSAVSCSTQRERAAWSTPNASQVSLLSLTWAAVVVIFINHDVGLPQSPKVCKLENTSLISCRSSRLLKIACPEGHDGNWSSFQLANISSPQSVTDRDTAPSARMVAYWRIGVRLNVLSIEMWVCQACDKTYCNTLGTGSFISYPVNRVRVRRTMQCSGKGNDEGIVKASPD